LRTATYTGIAYVIVAGAWVALSDRALHALVDQADQLAFWQTTKGWAFVAASGLFVYLLALHKNRREAMLAAREHELLVITDSLPGPVSRVDREGRYRFANMAYMEWFGFTPSEIIGKTQKAILGPDLYPRVSQYIETVLSGERVQYMTSAVTPDGTTKWALVTLIPDIDSEGAVIGHFTVALDVTERELEARAREQSESRYARLIEQAPEAIFVIRQQRIVLVNSAAVDLCSAEAPSELLGRSWQAFIHPDDHEEIDHQASLLLHGNHRMSHLEVRLRQANGRYLPVEASGSTFLDDDGTALHITLRDISAQKATEERLRSLTDDIESQIDTRTADLQVCLDEAKSRLQLQTTILEHIAHQAAPALDRVAAAGRELTEHLQPALPPERQEVVRRVAADTALVQQFIDEAVEFSRLQSAESGITEQPYDLAETLRETAASVAAAAEPRKLDLDVQVNATALTVLGDRRRLVTVIQYLLHSAIEQAPEKGSIRVRATTAPEVPGSSPEHPRYSAVITIEAGGSYPCAVDPLDMDTLVGHSAQPGAARLTFQGFGLAIAKQLLRLMGGSLSSADNSASDTLFTVSLPLKLAPGQERLRAAQ